MDLGDEVLYPSLGAFFEGGFSLKAFIMRDLYQAAMLLL